MKKAYLFGIVVLALVTGACTSTFLISKDGKGYFIGSRAKTLHRMLCKDGDLVKVLADTRLNESMQNDLFRYNCTEQKSGKKVKEIYASMTPVQRKDLRMAFRTNGYDINYMPC